MDLFLYPHGPGFRATDTSAAAARAVRAKATTLRDRVLSVIQESGTTGLTADEAAILLRETPGNIRPRCSELSRQSPPRIRDSGKRRRNRAGHAQIVWCVA